MPVSTPSRPDSWSHIKGRHWQTPSCFVNLKKTLILSGNELTVRPRQELRQTSKSIFCPEGIRGLPRKVGVLTSTSSSSGRIATSLRSCRTSKTSNWSNGRVVYVSSVNPSPDIHMRQTLNLHAVNALVFGTSSYLRKANSWRWQGVWAKAKAYINFCEVEMKASNLHLHFAYWYPLHNERESSWRCKFYGRNFRSYRGRRLNCGLFCPLLTTKAIRWLF